MQFYWWKLSKSLNADFSLSVIYGSALSIAQPHMWKPNLKSYPNKIAQGGFDPPALSR